MPETKQETKPLLRAGGTLPLFYLPSNTGDKRGPAAARSKYNLVLAFLPEGEAREAYLRDLARVNADLLRNDTRIMVALTADPDSIKSIAERLELPFTLLADEDGATAERIAGNHAALLAADKYGIIYFVEVAHRTEELPPAEQLLDWIEYIEIQCPECTDGAGWG